MSAEDVVWWSDGGVVLHRDPDCPPFVRARRAAIGAMQSGDYEHGVGIHSYDFNEDNATSGNYPPEAYDLCRLCESRRILSDEKEPNR